jgi:uncharacterized coiled-coil protein SlyX
MNNNSESSKGTHNPASTQKKSNTIFKVTIVTQMLCIIGLLGYVDTSTEGVDGINELEDGISVLEDNYAKLLSRQAALRKSLEEQNLALTNQSRELETLLSSVKLLEESTKDMSKSLVTSDTLTKAVTLSATQSIELTKVIADRLVEDLEAMMTNKDKAVVKSLAKSVAETVVVDTKQQDAIKTLNRKVDRIYNRLNL